MRTLGTVSELGPREHQSGAESIGCRVRPREGVERLAAFPCVSLRQKSELASMSMVPAAVHGTPFAVPTVRGMNRFAACGACVWGTTRLGRSQEVVLGVFNKAHLLDPHVALPFASILLRVKMCRKRVRLRERVAHIGKGYGDEVCLYGVGIAAEYG
ncbi:hypothetical protein DIPPA_33500 [Diplonema papillatum]|nr:hypothetical protein DIPPA_33500 [Diplonema papillatum]